MLELHKSNLKEKEKSPEDKDWNHSNEDFIHNTMFILHLATYFLGTDTALQPKSAPELPTL